MKYKITVVFRGITFFCILIGLILSITSGILSLFNKKDLVFDFTKTGVIFMIIALITYIMSLIINGEPKKDEKFSQ